MKSSFRFILVCLLLWCGGKAEGNTISVFRRLTTNDGLSNSNVKTLLKDSYGFLWIGTEAGLNRYDGYGFKVYTSDGVNGLPTSDIHNLQEDGLGNIWVKWGYGYLIYHREKDNFISDLRPFFNSIGIEAGSVFKVYVDRNKDLWVMANQKVFYYSTRIKQLKVFDDKSAFAKNEEAEFSDDGDGLLSIQPNGTLWRLDKFSGQVSRIDLPSTILGEISNVGSKVFVDKDKGIWLYANKSDLIYFKKSPTHEWGKIKLISTINSQTNIVQSIIDDGNGGVLIGTDHKGQFLYNKEDGSINNYLHNPWERSSLSSNNIVCQYRDDNGVIWIGHHKTGISCYHESFQSIVNFQHSECREVSAIIEDRLGNIWLGTDGNGLFIREKAKDGVLRKLQFPNYAIVSLLEDKKGRIWIGTFQNGLFCYESGKISQFTQSNSQLLSDNIWNLQEDCFGNIWVGSLAGGIQSLNPDTKFFYPRDPNDENIHSLGMFYDNEDKLYVGNVYGISIIDFVSGRKFVYYANRKGSQQFKQMLVSCIYKNSQDILFLGHYSGLTLWDLKTDSIYTLDKSSGLCDNIIRGIIEDDNQNVWITTSNGVAMVNAGRNDKGELSIYTQTFSKKDGFIDNYFNNHSIAKLRDGDLLFGGPEGYSLVKPAQISQKTAPLARVVFTGLQVGNEIVQIDSLYSGKKLLGRPMESTTSIEFSHKNKLISFQITAGDLINASKVKYMYKLERFNSQWLNTNDNVISFSTIPPGTYRLWVKACNSDGVWNDNATSLELVVLPPFYLSNWAIVMYYLLAIGSIVFFFVKRQKLHARKIVLQQKRMEQEQKNRLNELKLKFFTNVSHDLRTPLTLILTPLQSLIAEVADTRIAKKLQIINKNAEQLLQLMNTLLDVRKLDEGAETLNLKYDDIVAFLSDLCLPFHLYATEHSIRFSFHSDEKGLFMNFDADKIQKVLNNLLSNAFKFTPDGGSVEVKVMRVNGNVQLRVSDTGPGVDREDKDHIFERFYQAEQSPEKTGSGIGLHIVSEYVRLLGGGVELSDNKPTGAVFTVKLPITSNNGNSTLQLPPLLPSVAEDEATEASAARKWTILIVDDNKDFCEFMSDSLNSEYTTIVAYNGQEALNLLSQCDVDIVVSDVMMPVMSGTELCKQIKTNLMWSHIPVVLLTAKTADEHKIEGYELGADDYITKPFNFEILKIRIRKLIERTEKQHQDFSRKMDIAPSEITITSLDEKFISNAIKIVEEHIGDSEFSVEELGAKLGVSRSQLYKKLMSITGKGPVEFIRILRLKRGMQLLKKSQMQIAEIAYTVGFNSPKRFSKYFRNEFGLSPSDYLQQQSDEDGQFS